ncbi:MAG: hypothetical protein WAU70_07155 [Flavobacteriales bacterium]
MRPFAPTRLNAIRQKTVAVCKRLRCAPVHLVPTMTPQEVAREGRKLLPALHLAVLAECRSLVQQGAPVEHLLHHTTTDNSNWWVLVNITPQAVSMTALLRYRTPDQRIQAMRFDGIERTAHHYSADILEPILKRMDGPRDPHQRLGQFLLANYKALPGVVGPDEAGRTPVVSILQGQPVMGTWHKAHDLVCYRTG